MIIARTNVKTRCLESYQSLIKYRITLFTAYCGFIVCLFLVYNYRESTILYYNYITLSASYGHVTFIASMSYQKLVGLAYTKASDASIWAFPWMWIESTTIRAQRLAILKPATLLTRPH